MTISDLAYLEDVSEGTTPDLVDSRDLVDLHKSEMRSIHGGSCTYASKKYGAGSRIYQGDGLYECVDIRFAPDRWQKV